MLQGQKNPNPELDISEPQENLVARYDFTLCLIGFSYTVWNMRMRRK
jgi:hypothetical protein